MNDQDKDSSSENKPSKAKANLENKNIQLDEFTPNQIFKLLPIKYWLLILSFFIGLCFASFKIGVRYNDEIFRSKNFNQILIEEKTVLMKANGKLLEDKEILEKENQLLKNINANLIKKNDSLIQIRQVRKIRSNNPKEEKNNITEEIKIEKSQPKPIQLIKTFEVKFQITGFDHLSKCFDIFLDDTLLINCSKNIFTLKGRAGIHKIKLRYADTDRSIRKDSFSVIFNDAITKEAYIINKF